MYKEVPEDLMAKIKAAAGTINKHNCAVDITSLSQLLPDIPRYSKKNYRIHLFLVMFQPPFVLNFQLLNLIR